MPRQKTVVESALIAKGFQQRQGDHRSLRDQHPDETVAIQGMERKGNAFVVRLEVSAGTDKGAIEREAKQLYRAQLQMLETQYGERLRLQERHLEDERRQNTELLGIVRILAEHQSRPHISIRGNVGSIGNQGSQVNIAGEVAGEQDGRLRTEGGGGNTENKGGNTDGEGKWEEFEV